MAIVIIPQTKLDIQPVNLAQKLLRLNIGFLLNASVSTARELHFDDPQLLFEDHFVVTDFKGVVRMTRTQQGILFEGDFTGTVPGECGRCLCTFEMPVKAQFEELFHFRARSISDADLILPEDGYVELAPVVQEYFILDIPINPLCKEDCRGLCIECGANLNETTCVHQQAENG